MSNVGSICRAVGNDIGLDLLKYIKEAKPRHNQILKTESAVKFKDEKSMNYHIRNLIESGLVKKSINTTTNQSEGYEVTSLGNLILNISQEIDNFKPTTTNN